MSTRTTPTPRQAYGQDQLQRRTFTARAAATEGKREVTGTAVPWDHEVEIWPGFRESWAPGAAESPEGGTLLFWRHTDPIGRLVAAEAGTTGWDITGRVSRTRQGDEALTLAEDDVVTQFSVGFRAIEWDETHDEDGTVHVRITRAEVPEVSLVPFGAYGAAAPVTGTREDHQHTNHRTTTHHQEDTPMGDSTSTPTISAEAFTGLRADVDEIKQTVATLPDTLGGQRETNPAEAFRSIGEYAQALVRGDEKAHALFTRAVTTADTWLMKGDNWVGDTVRIIQTRQRILRLFMHTYSLPPKGMTVEYGYLVGNTIDVQEQVAQGDNLVYGEVKLGQDNAALKTFGGYTEVPRQVIERGSDEYLDFVFQAFAAAYGRAMELYARAVLDAGYTAQVTATNTVAAPATLAAMTDTQWLGVILDVDEALDEAGHALGGLLVGKDVLMAMASIPAEDKMLRWSPSGPTDSSAGTLYVRRGGPSADFVGVDVSVNPAWAGQGRAMAFDPFAMQTREAPGAPFRLQDENIINLTKQFSVYGYGTSYVQAQSALVPITFGA